MPKPTCASCRFYDYFKESDSGYCRRYAPGIMRNIHVTVYPTEWCGEHEPGEGE